MAKKIKKSKVINTWEDFLEFLDSFGARFSKEIKKETKRFIKSEMYVAKDPMAICIANHPKIKNADEENYQKVGRLIERYGTPDKYVVLYFCKDASIEENLEMYFELENSLKHETGKVLILPKGK